jgi:hypothetical protein
VEVGEGLGGGVDVGLVVGDETKATAVGVASAPQPSNKPASRNRPTTSHKPPPDSALLSFRSVEPESGWIRPLSVLRIWFTFQCKSC